LIIIIEGTTKYKKFSLTKHANEKNIPEKNNFIRLFSSNIKTANIKKKRQYNSAKDTRALDD
jgi:hypothetical protein